MRPLWPQEYLNSVLDQDVSLHSRRLGWETQLHFDNPTYISTHYSQVSSPPALGCSAAGGLSAGCSLRASPCLGGQPSSIPPHQREGMVAGRGLTTGATNQGALGHSCSLCSSPRC